MRREFPEQAGVWPDSLSRRQFLTLDGRSLALAGLSGCSVKPAPSADLVPYVDPPEDVVPGRPLFFATADDLCGQRGRACWWKAMPGGPPRSRAIPTTLPAWAPPTSSTRPPCLRSTTPTARRRSLTWGKRAPGARRCRHPRCHAEAAPAARRRAAAVDRNHRLADARRGKSKTC